MYLSVMAIILMPMYLFFVPFNSVETVNKQTIMSRQFCQHQRALAVRVTQENKLQEALNDYQELNNEYI